MSVPHNPALAYRPEIDGLRALAVLPVILYHAGISWLSGGFVGVDVFFVISGYLITSIILSEMLAGRFSLVNFYERRARRILPPLFVMLAACLPMAWLWLDPLDMMSFAKSLVAVPVFSSNVLFWRETGYFDIGIDFKPLVHTWTLAVEEQYYVFFPLILMASWKLGRRVIVGLLMVMALASLILAERGATHGSVTTFYLLHARAWELLVGSFIAFYFSWRPRNAEASSPLHQAASLLGVALIAYAMLTFTKATPFPGLHALYPTLGAALIILFATRHTWVGRMLATRGPVFIGLLSYSAYLWHQPLFAFARHTSVAAPSLALMLGLGGVSLVLAWISWRYIERPFRNKTLFDRKQVFSMSAFASVLFIGVGLFGYVNQGFTQRFNLDPQLLEAFNDPVIRNACDQGYDGKGRDIAFCFFGAPLKGPSPDVAVFGDSHAEAMLPAFDEIGKRQGRSIVHLGVGGCPPLLGVDVALGNYDAGACTELAQRQYEYVKQNRVKKVILVARWTLYTDGEYDKPQMDGYFLISPKSQALTKEASREVFKQALDETIAAYRALGTEVDIVSQVPQQLANPKNLYYRLAKDPSQPEALKLQAVDALSVSYAKHEELQRYTRQLFELDKAQNKIRLIDLDKVFCKQQVCLLGDDRSWYKDYNHLNDRGAQMVAGEIGELLEH